MNANELIRDIRQFCEENANPDLVVKYSRYFKEGYDAYGVDTQTFLARVKELLNSGNLDLITVITAGKTLVKSPKYEEPTFALLLLRGYKKQFDRGTFDTLGKWFELGIRNWAHSDTACSELLSPMLEKGIISMTDFDAWRFSNYPFQRRAVPVSLIRPAKKSNDIHPFLEFTRVMMTDRERVVHQGLGWFLREAWKVHPGPVEDFLLQWRNDAARLIFQYATEKMTKEERVRFRREK